MGTATIEVEEDVYRKTDAYREDLGYSWEQVMLEGKMMMEVDLQHEGADIGAGYSRDELLEALERRVEEDDALGVGDSGVVVTKVEALEEMKERAYERGHDDGYANAAGDVFDAKRQALVEHGVCRRCRKRDADSLHHIIPRERGGEDDMQNTIPLCDGCHDRVEILTEKMLESREEVSAATLRGYIVSEFPVEVYE